MALLRHRVTVLPALLAAVAMGVMPAASAAPPPGVQAEVDSLLGAIAASGCRFQRNGDWHSALDAQQHLRDKYDWLVARDRIGTTEQFIELVATKSSLSGQLYMVGCDDEPPLSSQQWLRDRLARLRGR